MATVLASRSLVEFSSPSSASASSETGLLRMSAARQRRLTQPQTNCRHRPRAKRMVGVCASSELVEPLTLSSADPDLTWQITVGAIGFVEDHHHSKRHRAFLTALTKVLGFEAGGNAGVAPFVIAGIEFSKRIIQQKRCQVCGGSGLVKRVGILVRCNGCGGFLPWQSWSRFFSSGR